MTFCGWKSAGGGSETNNVLIGRKTTFYQAISPLKFACDKNNTQKADLMFKVLIALYIPKRKPKSFCAVEYF